MRALAYLFIPRLFRFFPDVHPMVDRFDRTQRPRRLGMEAKPTIMTDTTDEHRAEPPAIDNATCPTRALPPG